jgi:predicted dienelactone hydrolase
MRFFEMSVLVLLLVTLLGVFWQPERRPKWWVYLPFLGVVFIGIHLVVEGYRWQMLPALALAGVLCFSAILGVKRDCPPHKPMRRRIDFRIVAASAGLLAWVIAATIPNIVPVYHAPSPTGPSRVGITSVELVDNSRLETLGRSPTGNRDLMLRVWYPASVVPGTKPEPVLADAQRVSPVLAHIETILSGGNGSLPKMFFGHLSLVQSHSYPDAPISSSRPAYPVLIFSPGFASFLEANRSLMEECASHGYVVVAVSHPYDLAFTLYPDGRIVVQNENRMRKFLQEDEEASDRNDVYKKYEAAKDLNEKEVLLRELVSYAPTINDGVRLWAADMVFVLNQLKVINSTVGASVLAGKLDLRRVGVLGESLGGAAASETCILDNRCLAGLSFDSTPYGVTIDHPVTHPYMFLNNETNDTNETVYRMADAPAYYVTIQGTTHTNFTELGLISPLFRWVGALGPIDQRRMIQISNAYILAFFDKYLQGIASSLLSGVSPRYPEVRFESRTENRISDPQQDIRW